VLRVPGVDLFRVQALSHTISRTCPAASGGAHGCRGLPRQAWRPGCGQAEAYAQNFLISKGLGKLATPAMRKEILEQAAAVKASKTAGLAEDEEKKKTIEVHTLTLHTPGQG